MLEFSCSPFHSLIFPGFPSSLSLSSTHCPFLLCSLHFFLSIPGPSFPSFRTCFLFSRSSFLSSLILSSLPFPFHPSFFLFRLSLYTLFCSFSCSSSFCPSSSYSLITNFEYFLLSSFLSFFFLPFSSYSPFLLLVYYCYFCHCVQLSVNLFHYFLFFPTMFFFSLA